MNSPIPIEVTDKVNSNIEKKIRNIATAARTAHNNLESLQQTLNKLNSDSLTKLSNQIKNLDSSLKSQLKSVQSSTTALNSNQLAAARVATEQARLQTELGRTAVQSARAATEMAKLGTEQSRTATSSQKLATEAARTNKELANAASAADKAALAKLKLEQAQNSTAKSSFNFASMLKLVAASFAVSEYVKMSDAITNLQSRLKLVTNGSAELNAVQKSLFQTAQASRTDYIELGNLYSQIGRSAKDAGISTTGLLGITKTISQAMVISGGSAESMKAALVQLSQGMASGVLRGEELNSVMEQTPRLAIAIADGLGVGIGKLREMGKEGKLTTDVVMGALQKAAANVDEEFKKITPTIGQAFTVLKNSLTEATGNFNEASGASTALANSILFVGSAVDTLGEFIKKNETAISIIAGGLGGVAAAGVILGIASAIKVVAGSIVALSVALIANPLVLALLGIGAVVGAGVAIKTAWDKTETGINRTNEALLKQKSIIEGNLKSGKLDDDQKQTNLETLAKVNKQIVDNNIQLDTLNGTYKQATFRSQELTTQNAAEEASTKKVKEGKESYKKLMENLGGVTDEYRKKQAQLDAAKPYISSEEYQAGVKKLKEEYDKLTGSTTAASKALKDKKAEDLFAIKNQLNLNKLTGDYAKQADALINDYKRNKIGAGELRKELEKLVETQEEYNEAMKASKIRQEERNKDYKDSKAALEELAKVDIDRVKALRESVTVMEEETAMINLSQRGLVQYAYAKNQTAIETLKAKRAIDETNPLIEEEIKLLERRGDAILNKGLAEQMKSEREQYRNFFKDIESGLTDSLYNAFQKGGSFGKTFLDGLKNMAKTTVLKFAIQGVFGGVANTLSNAFGMGDVTQSGAGGIGNLLNMGSNVVSGLTGGQGMLGKVGSWLGLGGGSAVTHTMGALTAAEAAAVPLGSMGSGIGAATGVAGAAGSGIMGTIGAAMPYVGLVLGAISLLKSMDDSGTFHTGALAEYSAKDGAKTSTKHGDFNMGFGGVEYSADTEKFTSAMAQSIVQMLDTTAVSFGKDAGYKAATAFADDTSKDGAWGGLLISKLEETIVNWDTNRESKWAPKEFSDGEAGKTEYLAAVANDVRTVLLDTLSGTNWATDIITKLGSGASLEQLATAVDQINAAKLAITNFGQIMPSFAKLTDSALNKLFEASGGVKNFTDNMSVFVNEFFTDQEKLKVATDNLGEEFKKIGFEIPKTREEFKALVQAQLALGDAGANTTAKLLALAGSFSSVTDALDEVSKNTTAEAIERREFVKSRREMQEESNKLELTALEETKNAADDLFKTIQGHLASINDWLKGTLLDDNSLLSPEQKVMEAQAQFDSLYARAEAGDADAMGKLTSSASTLRDVARDSFASSPAYAAIEMDIRNRLGALNADMFDPNRKTAEQEWTYIGQDVSWGGPNIGELMKEGLSFEEASSLSSLRNDQGRYSSSLVDWDKVKGSGKENVVDALRGASREMFIGDNAQWSKWTSPEGLDYTRLAQKGGGFAQESAGNARGVYETAYRFGLTDQEARQGLSVTGNGNAANGNWWSGMPGGVSQWVNSYGGGADTIQHLYDMQATANRAAYEMMNTVRGGDRASIMSQAEQTAILRSINAHLASQGSNQRLGNVR